MKTPSCRDCGAYLGQNHVDGCALERCPVCHEQLITCDCELAQIERRRRIPYGYEPDLDKEMRPEAPNSNLLLWIIGLAILLILALLFIPRT